MQNNDISNELTRRVLVTFDVIGIQSTTVEKKLFVPVVKHELSFNRPMLSRLYMYTNHAGVTLELIGFDMDDSTLGEHIEKIEHLGTNPFRYYSAYESIESLVGDLPYRPEVVGVLDKPERLLRYGHWGLDFTRL